MEKQENKFTALFIAASASALLLSACSGASLMKQGEYLYTGAKVNIISDTLNKAEKEELKDGIQAKLAPKPNSSILGLRPRLYFYKWAENTTKEKGLKAWVKNKLGERPVLLGDVDRDFNTKIAINYAENIGYFNANAKNDTLTKGKLAKVEYSIWPRNRYIIDQVSFIQDSSQIFSEIKNVQDKSLLQKNDPYKLSIIRNERLRIDDHLKNSGYYYFSPDNIIIQADSTKRNSKVALNVKLKDNTPTLSKQKFTIDKVIIYPDYSIQNVENGNIIIPTTTDSVEIYNDMYVIDPEKRFKPQIFDRAMYFHSGDVYNRRDHNLTLKRLINLGVFKFVKNQFVISDSIKNQFDAYYLLTPQTFQSLRLETLGKTNSANFTGGEVNLNWMHRNLFRGAEQLKVSAYGGLDYQIGGNKDKKASNIFRLGANAQLSFPRIIAPFRFDTSSEFVPRTQVNLGYEYQQRTGLFGLNNFNTSFGYLWKEDAKKEHDLKLLSVTFVKPFSVSEEYNNQIANNPNLQRAIERQLIFGPMYSYTYTNTIIPAEHQIYVKAEGDFSANLTGLLTGADVKKGKEKKIFGVPFSQYAKVDTDVRYYWNINSKNTIAARLMAGMAYPYGNSTYVPFSRQFFSGGSNSVRAFRARNLGPGSYDPRAQTGTYFYDQSGDIRLETNLEYRRNIYKFLNLAAFLDAGNIWLVNDDATRPGGKMSKDWASEIAMGAGVGVRLDFNIFLLRLDLAMPLRVPYLPKNERWVFGDFDFGNKTWRRDNLVLNIAIGYPF